MLQVLSHVAVACGGVLLVVWLQGREAPPVQPAAPDAGPSAREDAGPGLAPSASITEAGGVVQPRDNDNREEPGPPTAEDLQAPLRIATRPAALRVWHNTEMTLEAIADEAERFERFVWHFGDGADPASGAVVRHHFPESVADRHVTLEAHRADGSKLVVSRRVPIERLEVVPIDGEPTSQAPPEPRGLRLVLVGDCGSATLERVMLRAAGPWKAAALVLIGDQELADRARTIVDTRVIDLPVLRLGLTAPPADAPADAPLQVVRDEGGVIKVIIARGREQVHVLGPLALLAIDSRGDAIGEVELAGLRADLQVASAYSAVLLLSAQPLSALIDDGPLAPQAYRIYESALRTHVRAVISGRSQVAYHGRFGGLMAASVGRAGPGGCRRLKGSDLCQPPTVTLLDLPGRGALRVTHVLADDLDRVLPEAELPAEVGKYRQ